MFKFYILCVIKGISDDRGVVERVVVVSLFNLCFLFCDLYFIVRVNLRYGF